jgi:hypothetical protein
MATVLRIALKGHLTRSSLRTALVTIEPNLMKEVRCLVIDFRAITGYDADARSLFIEWNIRHKPRLKAVAVLTDNDFWPVLISAVALASRQRMQVFADESTALAWVNDAA